MPTKPTPILGGFDVGRTRTLTDNRLINMFMEAAQDDASAIGALYRTPGKSLLRTLGQGPIRGLNAMGNILFAVSGSLVFVTNSDGYTTQLGPIASSSGPVSMINNGAQMAFFDGINGYYVEGGVLSKINLPFAGPGIASYQDGFGLLTQNNSQVFWQSKLDDLSVWNALHFTSADGSADDIVSIYEAHREQWVFKTDHIEIYIDAGLAGFAFQRLDGVFPEVGCAAPFSVAKAGESLIWLNHSSRGEGMVIMANGYTPVPVSTHSIDRIIQEIARETTIADAWAYCYQEDGHTFYVITFPSGNRTFAYDVSESIATRRPLWHERAYFDRGQLGRDLASAYAFYNGRHLVGDYRNGNIYVQSLENQTDDGAPIKWLRSWRALPRAVTDPVSFKQMQIMMQTGIGIAPDANPVAQLRWSDDDGRSWSNPRLIQCGAAGQTAKRVFVNAMGGTSRSGGMDRIWELSSTDPADWAITGAEQEVGA